jgi:MFS family permease
MHNLRPEIPSYRQTYFIAILILGFLIQLTSLGFGRFAYTALLPGMKTDLGLSNTHMGFFQVGILTGYLLFAYLCSIFSKQWGPSIVVTASCALAGLAMMALGFVSSFYLCLMLAFLMGAGAVGAYIPLVPLIIGWSSVRWSGGAIGFALSGTGVGLMGWRYAWFILGAGTLLVALISFFLLKENPSAVDVQTGQNTRDFTLKILYRDPSLRAILMVYLLVGFGYIMYATFVVAYAVEEIGLSVKEAGLIWSVFGLFAVAGCFLWGMISDHLGRKSITIASLLLLSASILLSIFWKEKTGLLVSGALFAFTFNGLITLIAAMFGDYIPISKMGRIFGVSTLIHGAGQAAGVALAGYLKDLTATFVVPFLLSALIIGICPVFLLSLKERRGVVE